MLSTRNTVHVRLNTKGKEGVTSVDYNRMLAEEAVIVAQRQQLRRESRRSMSSTTSLQSQPDKVEERLVPLKEEAEPASSSNRHSFVMVPEDEKEQAYSGSTSPQRTMRPFQCPYPKDIAERVNLQRRRNEDLTKDGRSEIPDQGIVFDGAYPFDVRLDKGKQKIIKEEENGSTASDHLTSPRSIAEPETRGKAPMSQPFLTGIYAATSDPLMG